MLNCQRFLICDRDRKWSTAVEDVLETAGVQLVRTPFRAPNCNAYAERFVRSIKEECLDRIVPLGERHFRRTLKAFVVHYHRERNHQGLGNELIDNAGYRQGRGSRSPSSTRGRRSQLLLSRSVALTATRCPAELSDITGLRRTIVASRGTMPRRGCSDGAAR